MPLYVQKKIIFSTIEGNIGSFEVGWILPSPLTPAEKAPPPLEPEMLVKIGGFLKIFRFFAFLRVSREQFFRKFLSPVYFNHFFSQCSLTSFPIFPKHFLKQRFRRRSTVWPFPSAVSVSFSSRREYWVTKNSHIQYVVISVL